jgi:hypothetical protein
MSDKKFKPGDRITMSASTRRCNARARSFTGVVVGYSRKYAREVKLRRDGLLTLEMWHEDAWEIQVTPSAVFENAGAPC